MPTPSPDQPTLLIVDDDDAVRSTLGKIFSGDHEVLFASDGAEALHLLEREGARPHLILLDIRMPGPDGYEVCARIQDHPELALVPVVFVTALDSDHDRQRALEVGGSGYVSKPFEPEELRAEVGSILEASEGWGDLAATADGPRSEGEAATSDREEAPVWERLTPAGFEAFKERVAANRELDEEQRARLAEIGPQELYELGPALTMSDEQLARHLARHLELEFVPRILADDVALGRLPRAFCRNHLTLPRTDGSAVAANPFDPHLLDALHRSLWKHRKPTLALAPRSRIVEVFERRPSSDTASDGVERILRLDRAQEEGASEAQRRASELLRSAIVEQASDVHLEPKEDHSLVRFRVDGEMEDVRTLSLEDTARIVSRLKALADMDIAERRKPQDGAVRATLGERGFKLRLATSSTPAGESLVIRILEPDADPVPLDALGMTEEQAHAVREAAARSQGTILVVGPTGSGKSTTVFTVLSSIDAERRSLLTVEDPVEYTIPKAKQQQVNERAGLDFESLLKSAMRQDPDILFLGEVRDAFSANSVLDFASSGHLTISTLHAANAATAVFRLERLGVKRGAMAEALSLVVAQKLLRVLCPECKEESAPTEEERTLLARFTADVPERVARPRGCPSCRDTGYQGRTGVYEVLDFDHTLVRMVREGDSVAELRRHAADRGDLLISDHAIRKVRDLQVALEDAATQVLLEDRERKDQPRGGEAHQVEEADSGPDVIVEEEGGQNQNAGADAGKTSATVLVVEDEAVTRRLLMGILEEGGYEVVSASDGVEALMRLGEGDVDAVVSDMSMPNMDGETLLDMISEKGLNVPVLLVTGSVSEEQEALLLGKGAEDFLEKPVRGDVLLARLRKVLAR